VKLTSVTLFLIGTAHGADIPLFNLTFSNANGQASTYRGVPALKMTSKDGTHQAFARIPGYRSGTAPIDVEASGAPAIGASDSARGLIGIVFRQQKDPSRF
jgi:hypothetical protein